MPSIYSITLIILLVLIPSYILLRKEEKRIRNALIYGMASKFWILRERRRFIRFHEEIKIRYNFLGKTYDPHYSKTTNISSRGICVLTYERLKDKGYMDLELEVPDIPKPIKVIGQVVWIKDLQSQDKEGRRLFYAGIRFSKINPKSEALLLTHLGTLKRI